ncbi:MAG: 1-deoxy-D-xylulose-5-phosphate reductoisomerase [Pseudomonadota bacterium]
MIGLTVLGSTGSIGRSTLDVVARHPDRYRVAALTANRDVDTLLGQVMRFRPDFAVMADPAAARRLKDRLGASGVATRVLEGTAGLEEAAALPDADFVMAAVVGAAGLMPTLAAVRTGKRVLLANKEALVISGALFMRAARAHGATLLPIDSEHNAVFQCLPTQGGKASFADGVRRIVLTASGGPFRTRPLGELARVTPEEACDHPNWDMGRKISVDSATMMNKGLEVIEAHWLFDAPAEAIEVVIHPQSIVHSMVEYDDGSVLAQMGNPDMRTPIAHALAWPERIESGVASLDLVRAGNLEFEAPDLGRFPCLGLAYHALRSGGAMPAVLNAANEVAVAAFLDKKIAFPAIAAVIDEVMQGYRDRSEPGSVEDLLRVDREARRLASQQLAISRQQ